jgi:mannose-6-phosphate isomerase-like protein (cupin superfamily)
MSYTTNIILEAVQNENFRKVLYTGEKSQLVVMSLLPGEEIGEETHVHVEQTFFFFSGICTTVLDGIEHVCSAGDVVIVSLGVKHNFINSGDEIVKLYTVYSPANHIDGRIHATKMDAEKDREDEEFGNHMIQ